MPGPKLQVAVAGIGRMGKRHALHFQNLTPRATLVAVSTPDTVEREWAAKELDDVKVYSNYDEMLDLPGLQAVVIASVTSVHAEQAIMAIEKGLHVLCEKPLSTNADVSESVIDAYNKALQKNPSQKVLCGFSRRFDNSYRNAASKIQSGQYGAPTTFRSQTADKWDPSGFFVSYAQFSGGIFVDCSIHDIDLMLWFFGEEDSRVKSVSAVGITSKHPDLRQHHDRDNAMGLVEFYPTAKGEERLATLFCSRTQSAGQIDWTEIQCASRTFTINMTPRQNHVEIHDGATNTIGHEVPQTYYDRFRDAFITEANEFTACCLDDTPLPFRLEGAVKALRIGQALQESLVTGKKIWFDEQGGRVERAKL